MSISADDVEVLRSAFKPDFSSVIPDETLIEKYQPLYSMGVTAADAKYSVAEAVAEELIEDMPSNADITDFVKRQRKWAPVQDIESLQPEERATVYAKVKKPYSNSEEVESLDTGVLEDSTGIVKYTAIGLENPLQDGRWYSFKNIALKSTPFRPTIVLTDNTNIDRGKP